MPKLPSGFSSLPCKLFSPIHSCSKVQFVKDYKGLKKGALFGESTDTYVFQQADFDTNHGSCFLNSPILDETEEIKPVLIVNNL